MNRAPVSMPGFVIAVLVGSFILAGCTAPLRTMPPGPLGYRVGFYDGCDAGYADAGSLFYQTSVGAYPPRTDQPYLGGWHAGYETCRSHYQRIQRAIHVFVGPI
jgi:hypothetical protein